MAQWPPPPYDSVHALLFSKLQMFMMFGLENLFVFGKFLRFLLHKTSDVTRGQGAQFPGRGITAGGQKVPISHKYFFSKQHICFRKTSGTNMGAANLFLAPGAI